MYLEKKDSSKLRAKEKTFGAWRQFLSDCTKIAYL